MKEKILKLLKSGLWEDAYIAFVLMKDWTIDDVKRIFHEEIDNFHYVSMNLIKSTHIKTVKLNDNLYAGSGGIYSLWFQVERPKDVSDIMDI